MPETPETLEAAREMLLQNRDTISELTNQRDTLTSENTTLKEEVEKLRTLNQKLFLRATQGTETEKEEPEEPQESLEDFARNLKGVL